MVIEVGTEKSPRFQEQVVTFSPQPDSVAERLRSIPGAAEVIRRAHFPYNGIGDRVEGRQVVAVPYRTRIDLTWEQLARNVQSLKDLGWPEHQILAFLERDIDRLEARVHSDN